jgi:beta-barrel assembly-enhancing protease
MRFFEIFLSTVVVASLISGCVTTSGDNDDPSSDHAPVSTVQNLAPGERPSLDTLEGGLWMSVEKVEKSIKTSGTTFKDKELQQYVYNVACKLAGKYCKDIRVYIQHLPLFNASMYPNGMMIVNTGLLLRAHNEAQMAAVLGHEIAHYLRRHGMQRFRNAQDTANALLIVQFGLAAVGIPGLGDIATLIARASISAYGQDHEREADRLGLELMAKAGYDPRAASKIWQQLIQERDADPENKNRVVFFASHPSSQERADTLAKLADEVIKEQGRDGVTNQLAYQKIIAPRQMTFLRDETQLRRYARAHKLMEMLTEVGLSKGELNFFRGELHRIKDDEADDEEDKPDKKFVTALEFYMKAIIEKDHPPEVHKYMGLIYRKLKKFDDARRAFREYLRRAPSSQDRLMIEAIVNRIG